MHGNVFPGEWLLVGFLRCEGKAKHFSECKAWFEDSNEFCNKCCTVSDVFHVFSVCPETFDKLEFSLFGVQ